MSKKGASRNINNKQTVKKTEPEAKELPKPYNVSLDEFSSSSSTSSESSVTNGEQSAVFLLDGTTTGGASPQTSVASSSSLEEEDQQQEKEAEAEIETVKSAIKLPIFVERIKAIPLVAAGVDQYEFLKRKKSNLGVVCSAMETTVSRLSKPVLDRLEPFQKTIDDLDAFGCRQLDLLEDYFPVLLKDDLSALNQKLANLSEKVSQHLPKAASSADFHSWIQLLDQAHVALTRATQELRNHVSKAQEVILDESGLRLATIQLHQRIERAFVILSSYGLLLSDWVFESAAKRYEHLISSSHGESLLSHGRDLMRFSESLIEKLETLKKPAAVFESAKSIALSKLKPFEALVR